MSVPDSDQKTPQLESKPNPELNSSNPPNPELKSSKPSKPSTKDQEPLSSDDTDLINYVCDCLLSDFTLNKDLLLDWKSELTDSVRDAAELSSLMDELVLALPLTSSIACEPCLNRVSISRFLSKFNGLDDEIYNDLKLILFELFQHAISMSYTTKLHLFRAKIHELLIENLFEIATSTSSSGDNCWLDYNVPSVINQHMRLIINFSEFGCDIKCYRKLILRIYDHHTSQSCRLIILELLNQIHNKYPCHFDFFLFNDIQNSSISIPFTNDINSSKCLTIQSWIKIHSNSLPEKNGSCPANTEIVHNNEDDVFAPMVINNEFDDVSASTLLSLANAFHSNSSVLKVRLINGNQFMVEIVDQSNGSRMQFTFNQIIQSSASSGQDSCVLENQGYTHFALTYDTYRNLNLYIDGDYSESIPCPELHKILSSWNKIYIGQHNDSPITLSRDELLIRNLTVLSSSLSQEWVNLLFNLGLGYDWDFKDFNDHNLLNLLNHLNPKNFTNVALKVFELKNGKYLHRKNLRRPSEEAETGSAIGKNHSSSSQRHSGIGDTVISTFQSTYTKRHLRKLQAISSNSSILSESSSRSTAPNGNNETCGVNGGIGEGVGGGDPNVAGEAYSGITIDTMDRKTITNYLSRSKIKQADIVFDIHDSEFAKGLETPKASKILSHRSSSIHGALYSVGGSSLLLKLIESLTRTESHPKELNDSVLYLTLTLLFTILRNNWRIAKEFENLHGYGLLSILFTYYKNNVNRSLTFDLIPELLSSDTCQSSSSLSINSDSADRVTSQNNFLRLVLDHVGYDFINPYESIIINPIAYRFLVLNFELYNGSEYFHRLLYHFPILCTMSRFRAYNTSEFSRMKVLRKIIQFLKSPTLNAAELSDETSCQLNATLACLIRCDASVETIRSVSLFVIYSLYHSHNEESPELGVITLKALTAALCGGASSIKILKKFSRSITIHWILLLFNYKSVNDSPEVQQRAKMVVNCGLTLLTKLLKILGSHIIKRFFQVNHGLDILTHFLKDWWHDNKILTMIFLSSFGIEASNLAGSDLTLTSVLTSKAYSPLLNQVLMPDFLVLLNNLVLNSMYTLSVKHGQILSASSSPLKSRQPQNPNETLELSLNALHLINQYAESIQIGFDNIKSLQSCYCRREWLEGAFELVGHLKLALSWTSPELRDSFSKCYTKLTDTLFNIFVSKLLNVREVFKLIEQLSDFTTTLVLDIIFPRIFRHINEFVTVSNFIFNEKEFLEGTIDLMSYYYTEFVKKSYFVSTEDLDAFMLCNLSIIETVESNNAFAKLNSNKVGKLKSCLGHVLILKVLKLSDEYTLDNVSDWVEFNPADEERANRHFGEKLNETCKQLLYRQITILQNENVLDSKKLSYIIDILLGNFFRLAPAVQSDNSEHLLNFLRTSFMMRQDDFGKIVDFMSQNAEYPNSQEIISDYFRNLVVRNDEESITALRKISAFKNIFSKNLNIHLGKYKQAQTLHVSDMIKVMLNNGGRLGFMDSIYIKSFEWDCEQLKMSIISGELIKFNRAVQDHQENVQFFVSTYNSLKIEIDRLVSADDRVSFQYTLDYIENVDRMRRRLIVEDQLSESERLSYNIDIPIKKVDPIFNDFEAYESVIANSGIDTLSLSTDDDHADSEEGYEILDITDASDSTTTTYDDKNRKVIRSLYMGDQIVALWNVSQINGLVPIESLAILGSEYLYFIENYFHCADGNVIDADDAPQELRDPYLQLINFQSSNYLKNDSKPHRTKSWGLEKLSCISKRQFILRDIAVEMFFSDGASILITCLSTKERDSVYAKLAPYATGKGLDYDLVQALELSSPSSNGSSFTGGSGSYLTSKIASAFSSSPNIGFLEATRKWKMGEMSNFYYLMMINTYAGRTFNDLTQYPVFPWVIADYTSETLDLNDPRTFRDLSKPMGAQSQTRAKQFKERYEALASLQDHDAPPFHYGTHYSSAMIVTSFLIRLKPYVQSYLLLQGGKFDHADRLFNSIERAWLSASRDNTTDVRELTPEFFYLPEFLVNSNNFEFGTLQNGEASNDVVLPRWAKNDPQIFIAKNREALESPYVSANLHLWIDLIFGSKQNGTEAVRTLNVFHHLSYNGAINLDNINDDVEKRAIIGMINNFGQTPMQVFVRPHPAKEVLSVPNYYLSDFGTDSMPSISFESKLKLPIEKLEKSSKSKKWVGRPACIVSEDDLLIRKSNNRGSLIINTASFLNVHSSDITSILQIGHKLFLAGAADGVIQVWKCNTKPVMSLQFQCLLRAHVACVKTLRYSKTFKVCISVDTDGVVILWDLTRFKFIRKIKQPTNIEHPRVLVSISNDTGNFATIYSSKYTNTLTVYTINGKAILKKKLKPGLITCVAFGSINDGSVNSGYRSVSNDHTYWSNDMIVLTYGAPSRAIEIYEIVPLKENNEQEEKQEWSLSSVKSVQLDKVDFGIAGDITALELFKKSEVDMEEKLCRGYLRLVIGDSTGRVYTW